MLSSRHERKSPHGHQLVNSSSDQEQLSRSSQGGPAPAAPSGKRTRVLTVLPDFPFPATTGLHLRMVSNLELVHRLGCFSSLLYFSTEGREPAPVESTPLANICDVVRHGGRRFPHSNFSSTSLIGHKIDFLVRGALGLPGKRYPFSTSYDRIGAAEIILAEARRVEADFVVLPSFMLHYATLLRSSGFRVIADAIDVLTELTARFLSTYGKGAISRLGLYANYLASRTQERVFLAQCSEVWATSPPEAEALARIAPGVNAIVVANSLDENVFQPGPETTNENVGFIGTYSSVPNLDAARFLAERVFPTVLRRNPAARLKLAGANLPPADDTKLRVLGYVDLLGAVAESNELYSQCRVIALPVSVRGGVPLKIVEAFAREKAVVACPELVEGLVVRDAHDVLVRENPEDFAEAISTLLSDDAFRRRLAKNARETFMRNWSRSHAEEVLRQSSVLTSYSRDKAKR
jgi:glycosyltransferase involved in cell wall biosynthesis